MKVILQTLLEGSVIFFMTLNYVDVYLNSQCPTKNKKLIDCCLVLSIRCPENSHYADSSATQ